MNLLSTIMRKISPQWGISAALLLTTLLAQAQQQTPPLSTHRELWVPAENLEAVLKSRPRAVMLTPDQYRALIRDAVKGTAPKDPEETPPVAAVLSGVAFSGELGNEVVRLTARYTVESFSEAWSEIPLMLPPNQLAGIEVDEQTALRATPKKKGGNTVPVLVVRGKGKHSVTAEYHLPVMRSPAGNAIQIPSPAIPTASLALTLPEGAKLDSELPFVTGESDPNVAHFVLPAQAGETFEIRWTARTIAAIPDAAVFQTCRYLYSIDSTRIQADLGLVLSSSLAELPRDFSISVPDDARVLSIEGSELLCWTRQAGENGALKVVLTAGKHQAADLRILIEADVPKADKADADIRLTLPIAEIAGVHRASGTMAILGSDDVRVKNIATGPLTVAAPEAIDPALRNHEDFVTGFRFPVTTVVPEVILSPVRERFSAQLDTRIELKREAIHLTRQLSLAPLEGRLFSTELILPEGEELIGVVPTIDGTVGFDWARLEGNRVRLSWQQGLVAGDAPALVIESRRDPDDWFSLGEAPMALTFSNAQLSDAEAVSGYVAVAFNESFRIETVSANGLEARDGRTTPITGALAWFRLSDYSLELRAARRPTEIEAAMVAYALPMASALEIEGQLDLAIRYSPIAEIVVATDPAIAEQLRFDSPLLAEKRLDTETGAWTLSFHDEQIGTHRLRFRMVLPFEMEESDDASGQKRFAVNAPVLSLPMAKRLRGDWIIEANTDTELSFDAKGLDMVDSLRVPVVDGYAPRHRVIAAYQYRGDAWNLEIAGTRHAPEELVTTVVDSLRIDTVVSTDGDDRHQAVLQLRTSGEQFLEIGLPKDALVWTLTVDGEAVKPVRAEPGTLRVQLPARDGRNDAAITLKIVYQTLGREWGGSGWETLEPIRLAGRIPVMRSDWQLHLPEGFDYQKFRGNLREEFQIVDRTLLGQVWGERDRFLPELSLPMPMADTASKTAAPGDFYGDVAVTAMGDVRRKAEVVEFATNGHGAYAVDSAKTAAIEQKLKSIIVPNIDFTNLPLKDALDALESQARENDPEGLGIDIRSGIVGDAGLDPFGNDEGATPITLKLTNVPLVEALRYTLALANLKYQVEADSVALVPLSTPDRDLFTNVYRVPQNFMEQLSTAGRAGAMGGGGGGAADPFAAAPAEPDTANSPQAAVARQSAKQVLENFGITFGEGSSATYNPQTGELIVRNSQDQMELVEALNQSLGVEEKVPVLGDLPIIGRMFGSGGLMEPEFEIEELVDSESGERLSIPVDNQFGAMAAYRYDGGTEYRVTASGVAIAQPSAIPADQLMTLVLELPNSAFESANGNGDVTRQSARNVLSDAGVEFPAGTSAAYNFATRRLAVRNTPENLEQVRFTFAAYFPDLPAESPIPAIKASASATPEQAPMLKGFDARNAGLIPIDFALPESGRSYGFTGLYAPEPIEFRYVNWERQVRLAWVWMLAGGLAFWFGAMKRFQRPILVGLLGVIVLTFSPLIISQSLLGFCNSLLIGWLVASFLWAILAIAEAWSRCEQKLRAHQQPTDTAPLAENAKPSSL